MEICSECGHPNAFWMCLGQCKHVLSHPKVVECPVPPYDLWDRRMSKTYPDGWHWPGASEIIPNGAICWVEVGGVKSAIKNSEDAWGKSVDQAKYALQKSSSVLFWWYPLKVAT